MRGLPFFIKIMKTEEYDTVKRYYSNKNINIVELDCNSVKSKYEIFKVFSEALKFPEYFGNNWDAFNDCITDLSWLGNKNCVVLIKNIKNVKDKQLIVTLIELLDHAHDFWTKHNETFDIHVFQ